MLQPGQVVGNYKVLRRIGRGAFADVYEARHVLMDRHVALKVVACGGQPSHEQLNEPRLLATFSHPNILQIYDAGTGTDPETQQGFLYLATELLSGGSLRGRLRSSGGRLPVAEAAAVASAVCEALACAHEHGVIHRDVKPENVLFTGDGAVKLADFGVSRLLPEGEVASSVVGTAPYLAPEGWSGATHQSDIWSVGAVLYEMVCGKPPFTGNTPAEIERRIKEARHRPLARIVPSLPPGLSVVVDRALEKRPAKRYARAAELAAALEPYVAGGSSVGTAPTAAAPRRAVARLAGVAAILGVTGLLGYVGLSPQAHAPRQTEVARGATVRPSRPARHRAARGEATGMPKPSANPRPAASVTPRSARRGPSEARPSGLSDSLTGRAGARSKERAAPQERAESLYRQARERLRAGDRGDAIRLLQECVAADSRHVAAHTQLALCYADAGEASRAVSELETVVGLEPRKVGPRAMLARAYGELGQAEKAAAQWRKVLELDATNAEAREALGLTGEE
jgi:tetratricopeptide (TPR) repeat protein